jgi:chemotaxis family two-component system response regulator Rcp1
MIAQRFMEDAPTERLILVIEDNPEHLHLIEGALKKSSVPHRIVAIANGTQAMDFLRHKGMYAEAKRPDLILLDLNLEGKDGREILADIKADPQLHRIPIVVLTSSNSTEDIFKTYKLQGNCYVMKSRDPEQLSEIVRRIEEFWLGIVTLPVE